VAFHYSAVLFAMGKGRVFQERNSPAEQGSDRRASPGRPRTRIVSAKKAPFDPSPLPRQSSCPPCFRGRRGGPRRASPVARACSPSHQTRSTTSIRIHSAGENVAGVNT
jgi:hypothetical protein